jgi:hypothetical protein
MSQLEQWKPKELTAIAKVMRKSPLELTNEDIEDVLIPWLKKYVLSVKSGIKLKKHEWDWDDEPKIDHVQLALLKGKELKRRKL